MSEDEKPKPGRPSRFNDTIKSTIIALAEQGKTLPEIGEVIGVSRQTLHNWFGAHEDLLYAVREARQVADGLVEAALFSRAMGYSHEAIHFAASEGCIISEPYTKHYPPDTTAAMFWLRNRQPTRWREKNEGDVNVNVTNHEKLTDEQLDARIAALLTKQGAAKPAEES